MPSSAANALAVLALLTSPAIAHSWVEQLMVISPSGTFTGQPGYIRNNTQRTAPGFGDPLMVHILPSQGQPSIETRDAPAQDSVQGIQQTDPMCKRTQQSQFQADGSPRLKAAPGDLVALRYQENGHVTLPNNQPGKPPKGGNVYVYGTTQPKNDEKFLDIFGQWNADGSGGDKRGKLLAVQPYDDGVCYQVNGGPISKDRQAKYAHPADKLTGGDLWCQQDIKLGTDAISGKPYTLYWVWAWDTLPNVDPNLPKGKTEMYTSCMDIDISGTKATRNLEDRQAPSSGGNLNNMAIPAYVKQLNAAPAAAAPSTPAASPANLAAAPVASAPAATPPVAPVASSAPAAAPAVAPVASAAPVAAAPAASNGPSVVTVTVTATPAAQPAAQPTTMVTKASVQASQAAGQPPVNSMPPSSLQIAAPVLSAPAGNPLPSFTGTASAIIPSAAMPAYPTSNNISTPAAQQCNKCKKQKRSLIFAAAAI